MEDIKVKRHLQRWGLTGVALLASWLVLGLNVAQAQSDFGNDDLDDSWGLSASGTITAEGLPFPLGTPLFAVGRVTFDGAGGCTAIDQVNIGGTILPAPASFRTTAGDGSCTYTVNADGTGFMSVTFGPSQPLPGTIDITFVLVDDDVLRFITTNTPGFSARGSLEEQDDD
jgi:hypothetical protein